MTKHLPCPTSGNVRHFASLIEQTDEHIGVDSTQDGSVGLFHILATAHDWCEVHGVDFDATLAEVRSTLAAEKE
jgi:hypothetical protein